MKTILLLDDDPDFRRLVVPALEQKGHRVVTAGTAAEATAVLGWSSIDLAIVDGLLPDGDGMSWITQLRSSGNAAPVVFVSACWRDAGSFRRLTKELDVALVLHKPVSVMLFADEIDSLLHGRKATPARPEAPPASRDAIRELVVEYVKALPDRAQKIADAVSALRADPDNVKLREEASALAHRARGTAGSYGFRDVGEASGDVEDALEAGNVDPWGTLDTALEALHRAVQLVAETAPAAEPGTLLSSGRLLAVSPSPSFLELVRNVGRQQLYQVLCAESVEEARAGAACTVPDAALLDLPTDEAASLARELRAMPGCEQVPFAFVSEAGDTPNRVVAAHAGASLFLTKPIDTDSVAAAARQLVSMTQVHRPRVLIVDDDAVFARHACKVLERRGITAHHLAEPGQILESLEETLPDLVLLDVVMPGFSGLDLCCVLRSTQRWQDLPIVMVTAQPGVQPRIRAFSAGADDYLAKPIVDEELLARVQVRVDRARLLRERYDKDALTGLLLRRPLVEGLRARLLEASRHNRALAVTLIDFDGFKAVNDSHGHLAGDAVLAAYVISAERSDRRRSKRGGI